MLFNTVKLPFVCLLILTYSGFFYHTRKRLTTKTSQAFSIMSVYAEIHLTAATVTEYTVGNRDIVPEWFNLLWHIVFLLSIIGVCSYMLIYLLRYVERGSGKPCKRQRLALITVCILCSLGVLALPIEYVDTENGSYSLGGKAYALYAVVVYCMVMMIVNIIKNRKILDTGCRNVMVASIIIFAAAAAVQIFYPYILLTGPAVTMIVLGIMLNTEDAHLYISHSTGLYNELGCSEIAAELLLAQKPFKAAAYVFLGETPLVRREMIALREKFEGDRRVICGTIGGNVFVVLPSRALLSAMAGTAFPEELPEWKGSEDTVREIDCALEIITIDPAECTGAADVIGRIRDIKAKCEEQALQQDELTGLLRRAAFLRQADHILAGRGGFTFLMIDMDDFKSINDTYGHGVGDNVLKAAADSFTASMRSTDIICRMGGDEFAAILPGVTTPGRVEEVVDRVRKKIAEKNVLPDDRCRIGLSFGAKIYSPAGDGAGENPEGDNAHDIPSFQELYSEADAALYKAKRGGKGKLIINN